MSKQITNWSPAFYEEVAPIVLKEPLASILGAVGENDLFVYSFAEAVLMAGHSCPAVAGAYKVTELALKSLYGDQMAVRGDIEVLLKGKPEDLSYGPQSQVISLITGAAGATGFKGLGGKYGRQGKLSFDIENLEFNTYIFRRTDTGKTVKITYNPQVVPEDERLGDLIGKVLKETATDEEGETFRSIWQEKVRKILLEDRNYPGLFSIEELDGYSFPGDAG